MRGFGLKTDPSRGRWSAKDAVLAGAYLTQSHFAVGAKDVEGAEIFYEPLASWDPDGNLVPMLAAETPNIENGGVAADGMSVTWKLKTGVQWHAVSPSSPTTWCSIGSTPPTHPLQPQRSAYTRTSRRSGGASGGPI